MSRTLLGILFVALTAGCYGSVSPAGVEVTSAPVVGVEASPYVVYEGRPHYWYHGRWYYRHGRHWYFRHHEPRFLYERRHHWRR